jgi:hypothetical protein
MGEGPLRDEEQGEQKENDRPGRSGDPPGMNHLHRCNRRREEGFHAIACMERCINMMIRESVGFIGPGTATPRGKDFQRKR